MDLNLLLDGHAVWLPAVALLGLCVGLVAGMFGVGGGFLLVPLLHVVLDVPLPHAVGVGLCQTIAIGVGALIRYRRMGFAETRFDFMLIGGSILGVDAGARILAALQGASSVTIFGKELPKISLVITALYTALFLITASLLWWKTGTTAEDEVRPGPLARVRIPPLARLPSVGMSVSGPLTGAIGFGNGLLSGLMGLGGGIVMVPIMLYGFGFNIRKAAGTGVIVVLCVGLMGTFQHSRLGNVHLGLAATVMFGSALAAQVGATLTKTLDPVVLRRSLALVLLAALASLMFKLFR